MKHDELIIPDRKKPLSLVLRNLLTVKGNINMI